MNSISPHDTQQLISQSDTVLIDVREPAEYASSHIAQSTLAPLSRLDAYCLPEGTKEVVVYCQKGVRSEKAIKSLTCRYENVLFHNLENGIEGWQSAGFSVSKSEKKGLTLERQVQLTIGSFVSAGSIFAAIISPQFLWFTGLAGAVLLIAGATGTNGLAVVLARMPWNK